MKLGIRSGRSILKLAAAVFGSIVLVCAQQADVRGKDRAAPGAGRHQGEQKQFEVDISFWGESGWTVTDETGTTYMHACGAVGYEDKVYPPEYWGTFPLFYFGRLNGVTVTITNNGPRAKARYLIRTEAYVLRTDGSNGCSLTEPTETEVEVARGQTAVIDASFVAELTPQVESGLDRFVVSVSHANNGAPGAGLVAVREGIFCPPLEEPPEEAF